MFIIYGDLSNNDGDSTRGDVNLTNDMMGPTQTHT